MAIIPAFQIQLLRTLNKDQQRFHLQREKQNCKFLDFFFKFNLHHYG